MPSNVRDPDIPQPAPSAARHTRVERWSGIFPKTGAAWCLHCGDAAEVLATLRPDHYRCVITSPP